MAGLGDNDGAIRALGAAMGLPQLSLDADGQCELLVDGDLSVLFVGEPKGDALDLFARLGEPALAEGLALALAEANFTGASRGGGWLAVDPTTSDVVLRQRITADRLDAVAVRGFAEAALHWRAALPSLHAPAAATPAAPSAGLADMEMTLLRL